MRVVHHLLLAHGWALQAFRDDGPPRARIGITLNLSFIQPESDRPADQEAAGLADRFVNRLFLDPLFRGTYPELPEPMAQALVPASAEEMATVSAPVDFLGINYYSRQLVRAGDQALFGVEMVPPKGDREVTEMGYDVYPEGLGELLRRVHREYGPKAIYITENGVAFPDRYEHGQVDDPRRIRYIQQHLIQAHQAIEAGVPLKGYFYWSLMDNFEWAYGYSKRFGLLYVVPETLERVWKRSAHWYASVVQSNAVPTP